MRRILIMGATSAIAEAAAREFARQGDALFLAGRSRERLQAIADDLRLRGASAVAVGAVDACEPARMPALVEEATQALGGLDDALVAHGVLPDQAAAQRSVETWLRDFDINALSVMTLCSELGNRFEAQGKGTIAVISSVAGDRGRQSNYAYGAAKAAVSAYCSGLRQRLYPAGVRVVTIKPGFVDTPMTASFRKSALWATPAQVARSIVRAMSRGTPVVYTPWFWRPIMAIVRAIPEPIFVRLRL